MPDYYSNFASSTVAGSTLTAGATSLTVATGDGAKFPSSFPFMVALGNPSGGASVTELVQCTNRSGDVLTIVRAQEGTTAQSWSVGTVVQQMVTAANLGNYWTNIKRINSLVASGYYVGGVTLNQTGLITSDPEGSVLFNGTNSGVILPTAGLPYGASTWTVDGWIKTAASLPGPTTYLTVFAWGTESTGEAVYLDLNNGGISAGYHGSGTTLFALSASTVYHVGATFDGTTVTMYVGGTSRATYNPTSPNLAQGGAAIGRNPQSAIQFANFTIEKMAIYRTALSAARMSAHASATGSGYTTAVMADNPIHYWKLGETTGNEAADYVAA